MLVAFCDLFFSFAFTSLSPWGKACLVKRIACPDVCGVHRPQPVLHTCKTYTYKPARWHLSKKGISLGPFSPLECFFQLCWAVAHQKALHSALWTFCLGLSWEMSHNVSSTYRFPFHLRPTESPLPHLCTVVPHTGHTLVSKIATVCPLLHIYFPRMMLTSKPWPVAKTMSFRLIKIRQSVYW